MSKVSISNLGWKPENDFDAYRLLQEVGIAYIEIAPSRLWSDPSKVTESEAREEMKRFSEYGLTPIAMQAILYGRPDLSIFVDATTRSETLDYLKRIVDLGKYLGIQAVVFGAPKSKLKGDLSTEEAMSIAVDFFSVLGEYLKGKGITFCIEATPKMYGADFITTIDEAIDLVRRVDMESIRINMDLGTLKSEEGEIVSNFERALSYAGHFHISEPHLKIIELDIELHGSLASISRSSGYEGAVSIEMLAEGTFDPSMIKKIIIFVEEQYGSSHKK